MKKLTILATVFSLLMLVSGCSNNNSSADTTTTAPVTEATTTEATTTEAPEESTTETPDAPTASGAAALAEVVMTSVEFPAMMPIEDEAMVTEFFALTLDNMAEYSINQQLISALLAEVIIVKPVEGKADAVLEELKARKTYLIDTAAFYPDQEVSAAATVVGSAGDYVYLICHSEAATAEQALLAAING